MTQSITKGTYRVLSFSLTASNGSPDTTTIASFGCNRLDAFAVDADPSNNRQCFVSCLASAPSGVSATVSITALGHTSGTPVTVGEPPDLSAVTIGAFGPEVALPHP